MTKMDSQTKAQINKINAPAEIKMGRIGRCAGVSPLSQSDPSPVLNSPHHPKNGPKRNQETDNTKPLTSLHCKLGAGFKSKNGFQ